MVPLLTKKTFQCDRYCGECCKKLVVSLSKKDIEKIKRLGHDEEEFLEKDLINPKKFILKKDKNGCVFLKKEKDEKYSCNIYKNRPEICRHYPFFGKNPKPIKSCLPKDMYPSAFISFSSIVKNNQ